MKIQSIIRRAAGTTVAFPTETYRFSDENDHVCDVTDDGHIARLLSIKEGFRELSQVTVSADTKVPAQPEVKQEAKAETPKAETPKRGGRKPRQAASDTKAPAGNEGE